MNCVNDHFRNFIAKLVGGNVSIKFKFMEAKKDWAIWIVIKIRNLNNKHLRLTEFVIKISER